MLIIKSCMLSGSSPLCMPTGVQDRTDSDLLSTGVTGASSPGEPE